MTSPFWVETLDKAHDRAGFSCGEEPLDRYFQTQVTQDVRRRVAACFVAVDASSGRVAAYYTLASASIPITGLPDAVRKKLPRYPSLPAVRIGRLAVDQQFQGRGLGAALLADALARVLAAPPVTYALLVDAKHDRAAAFYRHFGFIDLLNEARTLFLPVATAEQVFRA